jgi:beta-glucanase (GH16 family)
MEIRVKYAYDNVYSIKGIGTGGGAEGLTPYVAEDSTTDAAAQAQVVLDSIVSGETVAMTMTASDGVGGGRYEVPSEPNQVSGFDSSFDWYYAENGATLSEPAYSLKVESPDGTAAVQCWQGQRTGFLHAGRRNLLAFGRLA